MEAAARALAKKQLSALIGRVLDDGMVTDGEREELRRFYRDALLSVGDVKEVFSEYLQALEADVLADGIITRAEAERCQRVIDQLKIPLSLLPPHLLDIVTGKIKPV